MTGEHTPGAQNVEIAVTWTLVGIPLAYGIYNTITKVSQMF